MRLFPPCDQLACIFPTSPGGLRWFQVESVKNSNLFLPFLTGEFLPVWDCLWHWAFSSCQSHPQTPPWVFRPRFQTENFPGEFLKVATDPDTYNRILFVRWKLSKNCILSGQVLNITETFQILLIFKGDCRAMLGMNNWRSHVMEQG